MRKVVKEINSDLGNIMSFRLECLMWEDLPTRIGERVQNSISEAFDNFEIYLGLMGFYFGTPTGNFGSGTEEEYNQALNQWKERRLEFIQFYFSSATVDVNRLDLTQVQKVRAFREAIGNDGVLYKNFNDLNVLEALVRSALISDIGRMLDQSVRTFETPNVANYKNLNPYGQMKALTRLMEKRPEAAINFLSHAGVTAMQSANSALGEITKKMEYVGRKADSFSRLLVDLSNGRRKQNMATKHLEELYVGIESLLRTFASETPKLDENFSNAISSFHRSAEIAMSLSGQDRDLVFAVLEMLNKLKSEMERVSTTIGLLEMPDVAELGPRWEIGRLTLEAVITDFREFISRGVDAIDVVSQSLTARELTAV